MTKSTHSIPRSTLVLALVAATGLGVASGALVTRSVAEMNPPAEHKGLDVTGLGIIPEASLQTIGLDGYKLQLREITIKPGGQIAKHSHEGRPGLVKVIDGTWVEGRANGDTSFEASNREAIIEDIDTTHWFWNRGEQPATAIVCDIVPSG